MRQISFMLGILFCSMLLFPCITHKGSAENETVETISYIEPDISVLNTYDNSTFSIPLESYLIGVVLAEMPASFESEALKAQSVAARTYAADKLSSPAHENADICMDSTCCCAYIYPSLYEGGQDNLIKVKNAVEDTKGEILTFEGEPILAVFHSMSAGKTEDAKNVWGNDVPYLKSTDSPLEESAEKFETEVFVSREEWSEKIKSAAKATLSDVFNISDTVYTPSGYVSTLNIGGVSFKGSEIRSLFSLRSSSFTITQNEEGITFKVKGYGHGVGLSQHGANLLARDGKDYKEILSTYYSGVTLEILN